VTLFLDDPLLFLLVPFVFQEAECAYTLFVVAIFWLTEALPLAVSALLPAFMFPLFGIMESKEVTLFFLSIILWISVIKYPEKEPHNVET